MKNCYAVLLAQALFSLLFWPCFGENPFDVYAEAPSSQVFFEKLQAYSEEHYERTRAELTDLSNHYEAFSQQYDAGTLPRLPENQQIPSVIHFIWLGEKPFPYQSIPFLRTAMAYHPECQIFFWTDRPRSLAQLSEAERNRITFLEAKEIEEVLNKDPICRNMFYSSANEGEKADLLRYLILFQQGGLYLDHDVRVYQSFVPFFSFLSFFCFCDRLYPMVLHHYVKFTNAVLASAPGSRVIKKVLDEVKKGWGKWETFFDDINFSFYSQYAFRLEENDALYSHSVFLKTFIPLTVALKKMSLEIDEQVFPPQLGQHVREVSETHPLCVHKTAMTWWKGKKDH